MNDPQLLAYYRCDACHHVFDWARTMLLPNGVLGDGSRCCPRCRSEFTSKFRESDAAALMAKVECLLERLESRADEPTVVGG